MKPDGFLARTKLSPRYAVKKFVSPLSSVQVLPLQDSLPPHSPTVVLQTPDPLWGWGSGVASSKRLRPAVRLSSDPPRRLSVDFDAVATGPIAAKPVAVATAIEPAVVEPASVAAAPAAGVKRDWARLLGCTPKPMAMRSSSSLPDPPKSVSTQQGNTVHVKIESQEFRDYWDHHSGTVCRLSSDGSTEFAVPRAGLNGFVEAVFANGHVYLSDIPNLSRFRDATPTAKDTAKAEAK